MLSVFVVKKQEKLFPSLELNPIRRSLAIVIYRDHPQKINYASFFQSYSGCRHSPSRTKPMLCPLSRYAPISPQLEK